MQVSLSCSVAMRDSSRTRVGSPSALNRRASCSASSTLMTSPAGLQHAASSVGAIGSWVVVMPTSLPRRIDRRRYIGSVRCIEGRRWESVMTDVDLREQVREQVRERYAAAANRVTAGGTNSEV